MSDQPPEPQRLWAVTRGSYSDYRVLALFGTEEQANEAASMAGDYDVESFMLCPAGAEFTTDSVTTFSASQEFRDDGEVRDLRISVDTEPWFDRWRYCGPRPTVRFVRAPAHKDLGGRLEIQCTDREALMKAATDMKSQLLAHRDLTGKVGPETKDV